MSNKQPWISWHKQHYDISINSINTKQRIENEIDAWKEIYADTFKLITPSKKFQVKIIPNSLKIYQSNHPKCQIKIRFEYVDNYPKIPPIITVHKTYNFNKKDIAELNNIFNSIIAWNSEENMEMGHDILQAAQEWVNRKIKELEPLNISMSSSSEGEVNCNKDRKSNVLDGKQIYQKWDSNAFENIRYAAWNNNNNNNNNKQRLEYNSVDSNKSSNLEWNIINSSRNSNALSNHNRRNSSDNNGDEDHFQGDNNTNLRESINEEDHSKTINSFPQYSHFSRFKTDFKIICKIGQGGGGSVFKVQHQWDKMFYAIKRIKISIPKKGNLNTILKTVMSEGYVLSRMQNPFIVRYYQTWIEDYQEEDYEDEKEDENEFELCNDCSSETKRKLSYETKTISRIPDPFNISHENSSSNKSFTLTTKSIQDNGIWGDVSEGEEENDDGIKEKIKEKEWKEGQEKKRKSNIKTLYIQMEYCEGKTLREAIDNKSLSQEQKWKLIRQILEAVNFIHSKKLIHRDIKPGNIFWDVNYNVKLGDFGWAKLTKTKSQWDELIFPKKEMIKYNDDLMTCAIGTKYYCSPEQEKSKHYNNKSDWFSIGIIVFEMFYEFGSWMERDIVLRAIKDEEKFPENFKNNFDKNIVKIVTMCTSRNPKLRPKTEDLLNSNLIPIVLNEQIIIENFNKIIDENKNLSNKFLEILIDNNIERYNTTPATTTTEQSQSHINKTNATVSCSRSESFQSNLWNTIKITNISNEHLAHLYEKVQHKIKKVFHKNNSHYTRFPEIELYDSSSFYWFDKETKKTSKIKISNTVNFEDLMLTRSCDVYIKSTNIYNQLSTMLVSLDKQKHLKALLPICFYTDYVVSQNSIGKEYLDLLHASIWEDVHNSKVDNNTIICDYSEKYIVDSLILVFNSLEKFNFHPKNLSIRINSSDIFDQIFIKILGRRGNHNQVQLETLRKISQITNQRSMLLSLKELKKYIYKNKILFPLNKDKLDDWISWMNISGELESIKKRFDKKFLFNEIISIADLFTNSQYWNGKFNWNRYFKQIKFDFSFIPSNWVYYSGLFFQVVYTDETLSLPIIEGGNIDNYWNTYSFAMEGGSIYNGISFVTYIDNIIIIEQSRFKGKEDSMAVDFKFDILWITISNQCEHLIEDAIKVWTKEKLCFEIIHRPQSNTDFNDYFQFYRMKCLLIIKTNKSKILYEAKTKEVNKEYEEHFDIKEVIQMINLSSKKKNK